MEIGKEIRQSKFKNEYQKLFINILYTANCLRGRTNESLKKFDLTAHQYNILRILRGQHPNPCTVNLLIERMLDKQSNASRIVDKLVAKKLVKRTECTKDRRAMDVIITQKGMDLLETIDPEMDKGESSIHSITPEEAKKLNNLLDKLRDSFKE